MRVPAAVLEHDRHGQGNVFFERAIRKFPLELQQFRTGLRDIDVDGIELLHRGQGLVLGCLDQRSFRDRGLADAARDRRGDARVTEHHASRRECRAARLQFGLGLAKGRDGIVVVLRADDAGLHQFAGPAGPQPSGLQRGFGARDRRLRDAVVRAIGRVVKLIEGLAGLDVGALGKEPCLDDTGHLGPDLGNQEGAGAARELADQRDWLGAQRDDGDRHRAGALRGSLLSLAASGKRGRQGNGRQDDVDAHGAVVHFRASNPMSGRAGRPRADEGC